MRLRRLGAADVSQTQRAQMNRDGTITVVVDIPPTPEWAMRLDTAFQRLNEFCGPASRWHFAAMIVPGHSVGYICVLERKASATSMSGSAGLEGAVAGWGSSQNEAIDSAISQARESL